jgi:hypothetical protein
VDLMTRRTLDGIHFLDRRQLEGLRIHRVACINHFARVRALDQNPIHFRPSRRALLTPAKRVPSLRVFTCYQAHLTWALTDIVWAAKPISFDTTK